MPNFTEPVAGIGAGAHLWEPGRTCGGYKTGGLGAALKMNLGAMWATVDGPPLSAACLAGGALVELRVLSPAHCTDGETEARGGQGCV